VTATFSLVEDRTTVDRHVYRCILCAWLVSQLVFGTRRPYLI